MIRNYLLIFILIFTCNRAYSQPSGNNKEFEYFHFSDTFNLKVLEYHRGINLALGHTFSYSLIIGIPCRRVSTSDTLTVLASYFDSSRLVGSIIKVIPRKNPIEGRSGFSIMKMVSDTTINSIFYKDYILGSQYPAIWGYITK